MSLITTARGRAASAFGLAAARRGYVKLGAPGGGFEPEFEPILVRCREFTMTSPERMYAVYSAVRYAVEAGVPGDFVECGVWRGGCAMVAAMTLQLHGDRERSLHLYDTFRGMSKPGPRDGDAAAVKWRLSRRRDHNAWCYAGSDEVVANLASTGFRGDRVRLVEGRVEDTLPATRPDAISVLRLDTDWYESTYHELVHLYPLLAPHGVLLLDDYGHWAGHREAVDRYFEERGETILLNRIDAGGRVGVRVAAAESRLGRPQEAREVPA